MTSPAIDQSIRDGAIRELTTTFLVEASAGTGKTTLAIERILHALRTGHDTMDRIVAITFTEKAAAELKLRLRTALQSARLAAQREERQRFESALRQIERSHIHTIHGFCSWLLKERPIEARVDPGFQVLDALQTELLQEETWSDWLDQQMDAPPEVLKRALFAEITPAQIRQIAFDLVRNRDRIAPSILSAGDYALGDGIAELQRVLGRLEPLLANCADEGDGACQQIRALLRLSERIGAMPSYRQEYEIIHSVRVKRNAGAQTNWNDKDSLKTIKRAYEELLAVPAKRGAALLRDLAHWLRGFAGAWEQAKRERGALDFDDLLILTRRLLQSDPAVRGYFQRQIGMLLVDEFQDTDPVQTEIVFFLAENGANAVRWDQVRLEPGKLFLVGDPKQSIYRFRRADIETYAAAKHLITGPPNSGEVLQIRQSFRSASSLLAWVDETFVQLIQPPADGGMYQPQYVGLHPSSDRHTSTARVCVLEPASEPGEPATGAGIDAVRNREAREVARLIDHMVRTGEWPMQGTGADGPRPPRYRDFAILLHSPATSLAAYESALQQQGIPYQVDGGKDYFQSQEIRAVCALLLVLDDPTNARELVGVLRSAIFGFSDEEIYLWAREHPLDYLVDHPAPAAMAGALAALRRLHDCRNQGSFAGFLDLIYRELKLPELFSLQAHGDQRVANLMKLPAIARRLQDAGLLSLREFVDYLRSTALDRSEEGQSPSAEEQDDVAHVLSIHKAKGLEWNIVVLGDLGGEKRAHHPLVLASRDSQQVAIRLNQDLCTENYEPLHDQEKKRQAAEESRLLYVAATRARNYLVLPWFAEKGHYLGLLKRAFDPARSGAAIATFFRRGTDRNNAARPANLQPVRVDLDSTDPAHADEIERLGKERVEWRTAREGMLARINRGRQRAIASGVVRSTAESPEPGTPGEAGARAALFGTVMHEWMAKLDWQDPGRASDLWRACAEKSGLEEGEIERGLTMIRRFMRTELFGKIRNAKEIHQEIPFAFQRGSTLVEGTADLLFRDETGWVLVDFKTDQVDETELEARAERYRSQMEAYAEAIETIGGMRPAKILMFLAVAREMKLD